MLICYPVQARSNFNNFWNFLNSLDGALGHFLGLFLLLLFVCLFVCFCCWTSCAPWRYISPCYLKTLKCPLQRSLTPSTLISRCGGGDQSPVPLDFLSRPAHLSMYGHRWLLKLIARFFLRFSVRNVLKSALKSAPRTLSRACTYGQCSQIAKGFD